MYQAKRYLLLLVMLVFLLSSSFVACDLFITTPFKEKAPSDLLREEFTPPPPDTSEPKPKPKPKPEPEPGPKPVTEIRILKYDDGTAEGYASSDGGGFLAGFTPSTSVILTHVNLYAGAYKKRGMNFDLEILDDNLQTIYSKRYPQDMLPMNELKWLEFELCEIFLSGKFYIHVYAESNLSGGMCMGFDNSGLNNNSELTHRFSDKSVQIRKDWPYMDSKLIDKNAVNWMMRAKYLVEVPQHKY